MPLTTDHVFDVAVLDREDRVFAYVLVGSRILDLQSAISRIVRSAELPEQVHFLIAVDPTNIVLHCLNEVHELRDCIRLDPRDILQHYDPEYSQKRVFEEYLRTLIEAWLRDLAYHWNSDDPPGVEALQGIGFLERLEGGSTRPLGG